jgi:hypothetical protein
MDHPKGNPMKRLAPHCRRLRGVHRKRKAWRQIRRQVAVHVTTAEQLLERFP